MRRREVIAGLAGAAAMPLRCPAGDAHNRLAQPEIPAGDIVKVVRVR
jgi:hypothetical protein